MNKRQRDTEKVWVLSNGRTLFGVFSSLDEAKKEQEKWLRYWYCPYDLISADVGVPRLHVVPCKGCGDPIGSLIDAPGLDMEKWCKECWLNNPGCP